MPNRLQHETSPYLLQHAHNPVDWFPWGKEALDKAVLEQKLILVSIGYSACHWCHVMERESFENEQTATLMNDNFINIKIDREERPDLDHIYMDAVQTLTGSGGWPLNVFLTPDAKPFYGGTYFPPVKAYNRNSWNDVLLGIKQAWKERPHEILSQAENVTDHLRKAGAFDQLNPSTLKFSTAQTAEIANGLMKRADTTWGGFGQAPKFPQTHCIQFLLRQAYFEKNTTESAYATQAFLSLEKMIAGGIYDHLQGGFARYSTDAEWLAPHFEKMLYDNALLIAVLSEAYQASDKKIYKDTIIKTMQFIKAEWQDEDGGFFSAYDADSEGVEGKYYTWSYDEAAAVIDNPQAFELFSKCYQLTAKGNWEHTNILWLPGEVEAVFKDFNLDVEDGNKILEQCRQKLLMHRQQRIKPLLDDKKILNWNALMITACCKAFAAIGNPEYLSMAIAAEAFVAQHLKLDPNHYAHNYKQGKAANPAFLDDLAAYTQALILLQECTGNQNYLDTAVAITREVLVDFLDVETSLFYFTPVTQTDVIIRRKDIYDGAVPSGNSLMASNLFLLGKLTDQSDWVDHAVQMVAAVSGMMERYPNSFANWALTLQSLVYGVKEIAIVGPKHSELAKQIIKLWVPNKVLQHAAMALTQYPLLAVKVQKGEETNIYVCENYACKAPVSDLKALQALL